MLWRYYWWHDHYRGFWKPFLKLGLLIAYFSPLYLTFAAWAEKPPEEWFFRIGGVILFVFLWSSKGYYYCHVKRYDGPKSGPRSSLEDFLTRWIFTIVSAIVAAIPIWVYLVAKTILNPQGFWQNFFLLSGGLFILGGLQIILLILFIIFLFQVIWD